jgi:L-threonylcarbamoyladenylate synthase
MPSDPGQCAHALFAQLRTFDDMGFQEIWVEQPPNLSAWAGVLDRLTRAASTDR